jgi:hypothetical protein
VHVVCKTLPHWNMKSHLNCAHFCV